MGLWKHIYIHATFIADATAMKAAHAIYGKLAKTCNNTGMVL